MIAISVDYINALWTLLVQEIFTSEIFVISKLNFFILGIIIFFLFLGRLLV